MLGGVQVCVDTQLRPGARRDEPGSVSIHAGLKSMCIPTARLSLITGRLHGNCLTQITDLKLNPRTKNIAGNRKVHVSHLPGVPRTLDSRVEPGSALHSNRIPTWPLPATSGDAPRRARLLLRYCGNFPELVSDEPFVRMGQIYPECKATAHQRCD